MNAATLSLHRPTLKSAAQVERLWSPSGPINAALANRPAATAPTLFPANSLARVWLAELHTHSRLRRAGEQLGFGLIAAGGLMAIVSLVVSGLEFVTHWQVFAEYVAHAVS